MALHPCPYMGDVPSPSDDATRGNPVFSGDKLGVSNHYPAQTGSLPGRNKMLMLVEVNRILLILSD